MIKKIHKEPHHIRKRIALIGTFFLGVIVISGWVVIVQEKMRISLEPLKADKLKDNQTIQQIEQVLNQTTVEQYFSTELDKNQRIQENSQDQDQENSINEKSINTSDNDEENNSINGNSGIYDSNKIE